MQTTCWLDFIRALLAISLYVAIAFWLLCALGAIAPG
jgi:hypothetical protein